MSVSKHLVLELDRKARLMLRDELVARLDVAHAAAEAWEKKSPTADARFARLVEEELVRASLAGFGFTIDEVRTRTLTEKALSRRTVHNTMPADSSTASGREDA